MSGVTATRPEYSHAVKRWALVRSIIDNDCQSMLWDLIPDAHEAYDCYRNKVYKENAILTNFTNLTKMGLMGLIFKKDPISELPPELEYLNDDVNGEGLSIRQFYQKITAEVLTTGRVGLLADYPNVQEGLSKRDLIDGGILPRVKIYTAESIRNWKTRRVGSKVILDMLTLEECIDRLKDDGFAWEQQKQYRVFRILESGIVTQSIYVQSNTAEYFNPETYMEDPESVIVLKDYNGSPLKEIPFFFVGSENNDPLIDTIPLYDIAVLNRGHYRNSADLEDSGRLVGRPTLTVANAGDVSLLNAANPTGLYVGSPTALIFPDDAKVQYLEASPNNLISEMMSSKLEQAAKIGARLIEPAGGRETAEAARIRFGAQNSALGTLTSNIEMGGTAVIRTLAGYVGANADAVVQKLNKEFYDDTADPNLIAQLWVATTGGAMTPKEFRQNLREMDVKLDETDPTIDLVAVNEPAPTEPE